MVDTIFRPFRSSEAERSDRSAGDRLRHRQKIRESIRENIADIIAEESIIGKSRDRVIKVPIRGIREYRFVYGDNNPGVGQGDGNSQPGQVVGKSQQEGQGQGTEKAGDKAGVDYYETDVTLEELIDIMFEDLDLPDLERKALRQLEAPRSSKRRGYRQVGIRIRLDKYRTVRSRIKRKFSAERRRRLAADANPVDEARDAALEAAENAAALEAAASPVGLEQADLADDDVDVDEDGEVAKAAPAAPRARRFPFHVDDLVYRHVTTQMRRESNAVVICIMDTSGSMDTMKKYLARSFFFLLYQFICTKYRSVEIVFISHHTEANEVSEDEFFHKGESGGTFISSGYQKALDIIAERYHPSLWNVYAFHCSDGDNFDSDNTAALKAAHELADICNLFGYGEIKPLGSRYYESSMLNIFRRLDAENFQTVLIERKEDIWPSFKAFLAKDKQQD